MAASMRSRSAASKVSSVLELRGSVLTVLSSTLSSGGKRLAYSSHAVWAQSGTRCPTATITSFMPDAQSSLAGLLARSRCSGRLLGRGLLGCSHLDHLERRLLGGRLGRAGLCRSLGRCLHGGLGRCPGRRLGRRLLGHRCALQGFGSLGSGLGRGGGGRLGCLGRLGGCFLGSSLLGRRLGAFCGNRLGATPVRLKLGAPGWPPRSLPGGNTGEWRA